MYRAEYIAEDSEDALIAGNERDLVGFARVQNYPAIEIMVYYKPMGLNRVLVTDEDTHGFIPLHVDKWPRCHRSSMALAPVEPRPIRDDHQIARRSRAAIRKGSVNRRS